MTSDPIQVLFAPDWREGGPYQTLLSGSLKAHGITTSFLRDYKRGLPLARLTQKLSFDVLHLHWPEAYYPRKNDGLDWFRNGRFALDLALASRGTALVTTAHNLHAHNRGNEWLALRNYASAFRRSKAVIAHSDAAREVLIERFGVSADKVHVIPHGDFSGALPALTVQSDARARLAIGNTPVCLIFGAIEPYKGIEEVLEYWKHALPAARLAIIGKPVSPEYGAMVERIAHDVPNVDLQLRRLSDDELMLWLSAVDCVLFNYQTILTSGAACLTRSLGIPLLLPERVRTVDLLEPDARVFRFASFSTDFASKLAQAITVRPAYESANAWREHTGWESVGRLTAEVYKAALQDRNRHR